MYFQMFLFDCFVQRLKHISIWSYFEFLLLSLLSYREPHSPPLSGVSASATFDSLSHQKIEKLNTVRL